MAVARKKNVDSSATGGWFRRRRSQRRDSKLSVSHDSTNVQSVQYTNSSASQIKGVSHEAKNLRKTNQNISTPKTSMPELNKKQRSGEVSKTNHSPKRSPKRSLSRLAGNEIPVMSSAVETMPIWLLRLSSVQRYTSVVSFLLVVATLIAYGWTVYSQQLWSQSYRKLQELQRNERQLTITNNALKTKIAAEAEKSPGLVSPTPTNQIFLPAEPEVSKPEPSTLVNTPPQQNSIPIGY